MSNFWANEQLFSEWATFGWSGGEMAGEESQCPSDPPGDTSKELSQKNDSKYTKVWYVSQSKNSSKLIKCIKLKKFLGFCSFDWLIYGPRFKIKIFAEK